MTTQIPAARLRQLREMGYTAERQNHGFVDPHVAYESKKVLMKRGEPWAAAVLGRTLAARSRLFPSLPALRGGEMMTLILADREELLAVTEHLETANAAQERYLAAVDEKEQAEELVMVLRQDVRDVEDRRREVTREQWASLGARLLVAERALEKADQTAGELYRAWLKAAGHVTSAVTE